VEDDTNESASICVDECYGGGFGSFGDNTSEWPDNRQGPIPSALRTSIPITAPVAAFRKKNPKSLLWVQFTFGEDIAGVRKMEREDLRDSEADVGQTRDSGTSKHGKLTKTNAGEVAERLKAAVC